MNKFRQPTPQMQLIAMRSCIEGHIDNWDTGVIDNIKLYKYLHQHIQQLRQLTPHLKKATWEDNDSE